MRFGEESNDTPIAKEFPELIPYQFAGNTPLWAIDLDGLEPWKTNDGSTVTSGPYSMEFMEKKGFVPDQEDYSREIIPRPLGDLKLTEPGARKCINCDQLIGRKMGSVTIVDVVSDLDDVGIGAAKGGTSLVPLYGSGRNAINDFQNGRYIGGSFNAVMAV